MPAANDMANSPLDIALFVTCPVDLYRPQAGFAAVELLQRAGCTVHVPPQGCCGQIAFNNGLAADARQLAWQLVQDFEGYDYVVLPSGSCGGMVRRHYPELFAGDPRQQRVQAFCERVFELTSFLADILHWQPVQAACDLGDRRVTYHDSCAGLRELGIKRQPRELLKSCASIEVAEMPGTEVCCGFGGTFCMKFPDIANRMAEDKLDNARAKMPDLLVGGDVSCLLHLSGTLLRQWRDGEITDMPEVRHVAELLAGDLASPPINAAPGFDKGHGQ